MDMDGMDMGGSGDGDVATTTIIPTAGPAAAANMSSSTEMYMSSHAVTHVHHGGGASTTPSNEAGQLAALAAQLGAVTSRLDIFKDICDAFFLAVNAIALSRTCEL